ncbi:MAG: TolC family protein [Planctomycetes bacterium]|nr:TolC family protein [Planctomycetota bacterium]
MSEAWLIAQARKHSPRLDAISAQTERIAALARQAGRWDDPEVVVELGQYRTPDHEQRGRLGINQRIPLFGSKARAHDAVAALGPAAAAQRREVEATLVADVRHAAANLDAAGRRVRLLAESADLARRVLGLVESRLAANQAQEMDRVRAQVDVAEAAAAADRAQQDHTAALAFLSRLVGVSLPAGTTLAPAPAPMAIPLSEALSAVERHPSVARATALAAVAAAEHAGARADGRPDITVGVFGERDDDVTEVGVVAGVTVPLWNGNRHAIDAAAAAVRIARADMAEQHRLVTGGIEQAWRAHDQAVRAERTMRQQLLPAAELSLKLAEAAYGAGGGDLATVLDARRTLARLALDAATATTAAVTARIDLDLALATETTP